jgi:hypothetical protein
VETQSKWLSQSRVYSRWLPKEIWGCSPTVYGFTPNLRCRIVAIIEPKKNNRAETHSWQIYHPLNLRRTNLEKNPKPKWSNGDGHPLKLAINKKTFKSIPQKYGYQNRWIYPLRFFYWAQNTNI